MIKVHSIIYLSFLVVVLGQFSGPTYERQTAFKKDTELYAAIRNNTSTGPWYSFQEIELFLESMDTTFDNIGDDMPYQFLGLQRRPKLIHSVGVVGNAAWSANPSHFTGIFATGCSNVFLRLSLAREAGNGTPYTPAISIKCLRNGIPSGNMVAMYSLQGQDSWNFFKHDFTNHVPDISTNASAILNRLREVFSEASKYPVMIGLSDLARYQEDGTEVPLPVFPFRLIFHPTTNWHNFFPDQQPSVPFEKQLQTSLVPGPIYNIYAQVEPDDSPSKFMLIGHMNLTSTTTTSHFGDTLMFYRHTRLEDDLKFRPDWAEKAQAIMNYQRSVDNYVYPDLPW